MRLFAPLIVIAVSIALFVMYTNPAYQQVKSLQAQSAQYNQALVQSGQLRKLRDSLLAQRNAISTDDLEELDRMLPSNGSSIRLIVDVNDVAARSGLQIGDISVMNASTGGGAIQENSGPVGTLQLSFSVEATYQQFESFLVDLEHSMRLVDVEGITFSTDSQSPIFKYTVQITAHRLQ